MAADTRGTEHEHWMRVALAVSKQALPRCQPNPPVGCVLVVNGREASSGFTQSPGEPHAEAMALRGVESCSVETVVYVTLEPCSFRGRTPSCAAALVEAGVGRVFVALVDPHPRNRGRGIQMLEDAGVDVSVGLLADEVAAFLDPYLDRG